MRPALGAAAGDLLPGWPRRSCLPRCSRAERGAGFRQPSPATPALERERLAEGARQPPWDDTVGASNGTPTQVCSSPLSPAAPSRVSPDTKITVEGRSAGGAGQQLIAPQVSSPDQRGDGLSHCFDAGAPADRQAHGCPEPHARPAAAIWLKQPGTRATGSPHLGETMTICPWPTASPRSPASQPGAGWFAPSGPRPRAVAAADWASADPGPARSTQCTPGRSTRRAKTLHSDPPVPTLPPQLPEPVPTRVVNGNHRPSRRLDDPQHARLRRMVMACLPRPRGHAPQG